MTVKLIKIRNVLGVSEIQFEPGKVTEISGRNAAGKTSILNAIRSVLKVGGDATLLRAGEESGEVVLVLDDDTEIGRRFTKARTYPFARQGDMNATSPVSFISSLTGQYALNPVEFIMAKDSDRVEFLLNCIDVEHDFAALEKITGLEITEDNGQRPLELIDTIYRQLYDQRTGANRALKEPRAAGEELKKSIPDNPQSRDELKAERAEAVKAINMVMEEAKEAMEAADEQTRGQVNEIDLKIAELQEERHNIRENARERIAALQQQANAATADMRDRVIRIDAQIEQAAQVENTLEIIDKQRKKYIEYDKESKRLGKALTGLAEYRVGLLSALPVSDVEIRDGKLYVGELPFDQVNSAEQIRIAFELARAQAGKLGLICVDGLELLDAEHYEELIERANNSDIQLIITAVSDDDLKISA